MLDSFLQAVYSVTLFVLLAVPGYLFTRKKWISPTQVDGISTLLVQYVWPIMVIDAMLQVDLTPEILKSSGTIALFTVVGIALAALLGLLYLSFRRFSIVPGGILIFALMFSNTGLIGMPLINSMLGAEALFMASIVELVNDILIFSVGVLLIQKASGQSGKISLKDLFSPGFCGMLLGLVLFLTNVSLPALLEEAFHMIAAATTPITMFLVGAQLGEQALGKLFRRKELYLFAAFKLFLVPAAVFLLLQLFLPQGGFLNTVLVMLFAMPSGACCALFARQYHGDYHLATACVTLTTVGSALTLPLWMVLCSL